MTTEQDMKGNGWYQNSDGTWSNPNSDDKRIVVPGDTGQIYIKEIGRSDSGLRTYDSERDR